MGFIFFGIKKATIGIDEFLMKCPSCEGDQYADGIVTSNYYHIYHIPIFPLFLLSAQNQKKLLTETTVQTLVLLRVVLCRAYY